MTATARYFQLLGWALLLFLAAAPIPAMAREGTALVRTDPAVLKVGNGQVETLHILLVNARDIYGIDLQATFDPAVMEVVDADPKRDGIQMALGGFLKPDFVVQNTADNQKGTLRYVVTQLNPTPPANGEGIFLSIRFRAKTTGVKAKFTFVSVQIADRQGVKQPVTTQGADLVTISPKQPTRTPVPTSTPIPTRTFTPTPSLTLIPATPTVSTPTETRSRLRPTFTARPTKTVPQNDPVTPVENDPVNPDQLLTYLTAGGFTGSAVLFGLAFWVVSRRRRKERRGKSK